LEAFLNSKHFCRCVCILGCAALLPLLSLSRAFAVTTDTLIGPGHSTYDNQALVIDGCTVTMDGEHVFTELTVQNGGVLTHSPYVEGLNNRCWVSVSGSLLVDSSSSIGVSGKGYPGTSGAGMGPGGGTGIKADSNGGGGGGAYGGNGGNPESPYAGGIAYGSATDPSDWGSAGGAGYAGFGGAGGGVIHLEVAGTCTIEGTVQANGANGFSHGYGASGGGAGGGIFIQAAVLAGSGLIQANGGLGYVVNEQDSGGGSGGRIALVYGENQFSGTITAFGASGHQGGGAGSIYTRQLDHAEGDLLFDNGGLDGVFTPWNLTGAFRNLSIAHQAEIWFEGGSDVLFTGLFDVGENGWAYFGSVDRSDMVADEWVGRGVTLRAQALQVAPSGTISARGQGYTSTESLGNGPGGGNGVRSDTGGGAGGAYGGNGSAGIPQFLPGSAYGSAFQPIDLGSAGGAGYPGQGGAGGGAIHLVIEESVTIDGTITADGLNGRSHSYGASGGGAGGSIWLECGSFEGMGSISATGGLGYLVNEQDSGGAGGGRIAIYHSGDDLFEGSIQAFGGSAPTPGGAGTIYIRNRTLPGGQLLIDNNGLAGMDTPWNSDITAEDDVHVSRAARLLVQGGDPWSAQTLTADSESVVILSEAAFLELDHLELSENSRLLIVGADRDGMIEEQWVGKGVTLHVGSATIESGCEINADAFGYTGTNENGNGPGGGLGVRQDSNGGGGGAGYGGVGGAPQSSFGPGDKYGSILQPMDLGSAGGAGYAGTGGAGGGAVYLIVDSTLMVDGAITANGQNGKSHSYGASGGGSGGSIWIEAGLLEGAGIIQANGGLGYQVNEEDSGGGAGGRIALYAGGGSFLSEGSIESFGGDGFVRGANGTIYIETPESSSLVLDNAGTNGAFTPLNLEEGGMDLVLRGSARVSMPSPDLWLAQDITVEDGAILALGGGAQLECGAVLVRSGGAILVQSRFNSAMIEEEWVGEGGWIDAQSITVESGGAIHANGEGYSGTNSSGNGPGGGEGTRSDSNGGGGGGGHGAFGGNPQSTHHGGGTYGDILHPLDLGSAGGAGYARNGGAGGGAISIIVHQDLVVDGVISANGQNGAAHSFGAAGGGSGGSIWLSIANNLKGSGSIEASGGLGFQVSEEDSGGGAGGRISVFCKADEFEGAISAFGAGGYNFGGAGTIYIETEDPGISSLIIENDGNSGTWTPLQPGVEYDQVFVRNRGRLLLGPEKIWSIDSTFAEADGEILLDGDATLAGGLVQIDDGAVFQCRGIHRDALVGTEWAGIGSTIVADQIIVASGGLLTGKGLGYVGTNANGSGPGGGGGVKNDSAGGGGGGHGGAGGEPESSFHGGIAYGIAETPLSLGSAGGAGYAGNGGSGGSAIRLIARDTIQVDGILTVEGDPGRAHGWGGSGGGAGGSIWLQTYSLLGVGTITANGGAGYTASEQDSGSGGGGRIAAYFETDSFQGTVSADQGIGGREGQVGTIVWLTSPPCSVSPVGMIQANAPIVFRIHFFQEVTGLDMSDFEVSNGVSQSLAPDGMDYLLTVEPNGPGQITCKLPDNAIQDAQGRPNIESNIGIVFYAPVEADVARLKIIRGAGGSINIEITGNPGSTYIMQTSSDGVGPWEAVEELTLEETSFIWSDPASAMQGRRFYRALTKE
jgi:hypothetical protein